jgi:uncharacterized protein YgbK (DUF1537 family)
MALLGVIADDFTGASDIANTLAKGLAPEGGLRTTLFLGLPDEPAPPGTEACVVALKSRSIAPEEACAQSLAALDWLGAQGCRQLLFKYCSTFDSTPLGNIGPVGEALARRLGVGGVVACPAFPDAGRSVYMGHLFVGDRLLNESGMERHPLNPMTDPDLRRWLARQCERPVGLVSWPTVSRGAAALAEALRAAEARGEGLAIVDAVSNADLVTIAEACAGARLLTGGSGIALGLPRNFVAAGLAAGGAAEVPPVTGAGAVLAGSCSGATLGQIERHRAGHPVLALDVAAVMEGRVAASDAVAFIGEHAGRAPLVFSSAAPEQVAEIQRRYGREAVAQRLDAVFAEVAVALRAAGLQRLVVAGGETSGAVMSALGVRSLRIGPEIDPGVPVLVAEGARPLGFALKSGNFGGPDFFEKALAAMAGERAS